MSRVWLLSANKIKSSNFFSKQPTQLIVKLKSSLRHIIVTKASPPLIDWKTAEKRLPWGIILLLGGGFALAAVSEVGILCLAKNKSIVRLVLTALCIRGWAQLAELFVLNLISY